MTIIDTHAAIEIMIDGGIAPKHAESIVKALKNNDKNLATAKDIEHIKEQMATKLDLERISNRLESRMDKINTNLESRMDKIDNNYAWVSKLNVAIFVMLLPIFFTSIKHVFHGILA